MKISTHEFKKKYPRLYKKIIETYGGRPNVHDPQAAIILYLNHKPRPKCDVCGNFVNVTNRFKNLDIEHIRCKSHSRTVKRYTVGEIRNVAISRGLDVDPDSFPKYPVGGSSITFICPKHGRYNQSISYFLKGGWCQRCRIVKNGKEIWSMSYDVWIRKAREAHGDRYVYIESSYINCTNDVDIICPVHGKFTQNAGVHSRGHGCPRCSFERNADRIRLTFDDFVIKCNKVHNYRYDYTKTVYTGFGRDKKIIITCPKHGDFEQNPNDHAVGGHGCPACGQERSSSKSKAEYVIVDYLESLGEQQVIHGWYGHFFEVDILVNNHFGIEYDGIYYHSTNELKPGRKATKHEMKTRICEKNDKFLVHIFENEWVCPDRQETWKSIIRRELDKTINIVDCEMEETSQVPEDFYKKNSLFSPEAGNFLTFSKYRKTYASINYDVSGNELIIHNVTQAHDCNVMYLFDCIEDFARSKNCCKIKISMDRRYENPQWFYKHGYRRVETRPPRFYYVWKYELTPHGDHDVEEMLAKGYSRIWDCGEYILSKEIK